MWVMSYRNEGNVISVAILPSPQSKIVATQRAPEDPGHVNTSQTSQHTYAPLGAPLAPAQTVQDAIQAEIARTLTVMGYGQACCLACRPSPRRWAEPR